MQIWKSKQKNKEEKDIDLPRVKIKSEIVEVDDSSSLRTFKENLNIIKTVGMWAEYANKREIAFITFVDKEVGKGLDVR